MELTALILAVLAVIAVAAIAVRNRSRFRAANEIVPGVASRAPASWAGSHTPEARLHRRIRDAVTALRATGPAGADAATAPFRTTVEQEALAIDERLVAVAALPERVRAAPLEEISAAVDALEDAAAVLARAMGSGSHVLPQAVADITERLRLLGDARAELDTPAEQIPGPGRASATPLPEPELRQEPGLPGEGER